MLKKSELLAQISESPTVALTGILAKLRQEGRDIVGLGAGEPDFDTPQHIKDAAVQAIQSGFTKYTPAEGTLELRKAISTWLKNSYGAEYNDKEIIVNSGAKHSVFQAIMAVCNTGDEVVLPAPYWVSYPEMIKLAGAKPRIIETTIENQFKVTSEQLEKAINSRTKAVILNSPSNPSGAVYSADEYNELVKLLVSKGIWVISDEIYDQIVFDNLSYKSLTQFKELRNRLIYINGVSKSFAMTGWRIGFIAAPTEIITMVKKYQGHTTSNPSSISQKAACAAYTGDLSFVAEMVVEFQKRRDYIVTRLNKIPGVRCLKPQGAFYVFPDVSALFNKKNNGKLIKNSLQLCEYLIEYYGVAIVPGSGFGMDGYTRISFATSMENLEKALDRIEEGISSLV